MPLQLFVDESGGKGQPGFLVLMGLIMAAEEWAEFSDQWDRELRTSPAIRVFKSSESLKRNGEFRGFSKEAATEKTQRLVEIVNKFQPVALYCAVDVAAFDELLAVQAPEFVGKSSLTQPYLFAAYWVMRGACVEAGLGFGRVEMIFDTQEHFKDAARWEYGFVRNKFPDAHQFLPLEPWFRDDRDFLPLQAADLMAGLFRRSLNTDGLHIGIRSEEELPPHDIRIKIPASHESMICTREVLQPLAKEYESMFEAWREYVAQLP
jgi:hypothetical protein